MFPTADSILQEAHRLYNRQKNNKNNPVWTPQDQFILRSAILDLACLYSTMTDDFSLIMWTDKGYIV